MVLQLPHLARALGVPRPLLSGGERARKHLGTFFFQTSVLAGEHATASEYQCRARVTSKGLNNKDKDFCDD